MKKLLCLLTLILFIGTLRAAAETLPIASIDWCPQICPGQEHPGYVVDIAHKIFEGSPYELEINFYPWTRAIYMTRNGSAQALLSPAKAEAPDLLYPEHEIGIQRMCFFTKATVPWEYSGVESLNGLKIGIPRDASTEELNSYVEQHKKQFLSMTYDDMYIERSLKILDLGRIDAFLMTYNTTVYTLKLRAVAQAYRLAGCVSSAKIYMAFSPAESQRAQVQELMTYFDEKMLELKISGQLEHIMNRYGLEDWQKYLE